MDIEGRLHSEQRRSQMTMMKSVQTVKPADAATDDEAIRGGVRSRPAASGTRRRAGAPGWWLGWGVALGLLWGLVCGVAPALDAQVLSAGQAEGAVAGLTGKGSEGRSGRVLQLEPTTK